MPAHTRKRLLDAAVESLINRPGDRITTGQLAAEAGVVQSAFYNHFASVDECRQAALDEVGDLVTGIVAIIVERVRAPGTSSADNMEALLAQIFRHAKSDPPLLRLMLHRSHSPELAPVIAKVMDDLHESMTAAVLHTSTDISAVTKDQAAHGAALIIGAFLGSLEFVLDGADPAPVARSTAVFVLDGLLGIASSNRAVHT